MREKSLIKKLLLKYIPLSLVVSSLVFSTVGCNKDGKFDADAYDAAFVDQTDYVDMIEKTNSLYELIDDAMRRKAHNFDKPIYVTISSDFSEGEKVIIKECLDYLFGVIGEINPNYKYEVVDKLPKNYSNIVFAKEELEEGVAAHAHVPSGSKYNMIHQVDGILSIDSQICIDQRTFDGEHAKYNIIHEMMHIFGMDDVYVEKELQGGYSATSDINYETTFMKHTNNKNILMIYPEDYKILMLAYAPDFNNEQEKQQYLERVVEKFAEYERKFYKYHSELVTQSYENPVPLADNFEITMFADVKNNLYYNPASSKLGVHFDKIHYLVPTISPDFVKIKIENNTYKFTIYNKDGEVTSENSGPVIHLGDQVYLRNVNIPNLINDGPNYVDLRLFYHKQNGVMVYDIATVGSKKTVADYYSLEYLKENTDVWAPKYYKQILELYKPLISDEEIEELMTQCEIDYAEFLKDKCLQKSESFKSFDEYKYSSSEKTKYDDEKYNHHIAIEEDTIILESDRLIYQIKITGNRFEMRDINKDRKTQAKYFGYVVKIDNEIYFEFDVLNMAMMRLYSFIDPETGLQLYSLTTAFNEFLTSEDLDSTTYENELIN